MTKLRLGPIMDEKPIKMTIELPATLHHSLVRYAQILASETASETVEPSKLVAPMLDRFMKSDKAFLKTLKQKVSKNP